MLKNVKIIGLRVDVFAKIIRLRRRVTERFNEMKIKTIYAFLFLAVVGLISAIEPNYFDENTRLLPIKENVRNIMILDSIKVYTGNQAGRDRVIELKDKGYVCKPVLSKLWRCTNHLDQINHKESEVKQSLERKITQLKSVQFGKQWSEISKTHESYAYDEWEMRQKIIIGDTKLDYYRFRHLRDTDYLKLVPGREGFVGEYLWSNEGLSQIIEFSMSHTEGYTRYVMQVPFVQH